MNCAWDMLLSLLPQWIRLNMDKADMPDLKEIRIREGKPPELIGKNRRILPERTADRQDIAFCINMASKYSPWAAESMAQGYIACPGGHRMGLCGTAVIRNGAVQGIKEVRSLCIRVARDVPGCSAQIRNTENSFLILGPPGSGKTTLLRDLVRRISKSDTRSIAVVDERGELFPQGVFDEGPKTDILTGCPKAIGIDLMLRTMGPGYIAVDEITAQSDCEALIHAGNCGVRILATAHAYSTDDLNRRPVYQELMKYNLFERIVVLQQDQSIGTERKFTL